MSLVHSNNYYTTITADITNIATSITVSDITNLPTIGGSDYCYLTLQNGTDMEIVKATSNASTTLTVVRAQQGTTGKAFVSGSSISLRPTKMSFDGKQDNLSGLSITTATVATNDKILIQDTSDSDNLKTVTSQSIADLYTIANDSITYAKIQNVSATDRILGRATAGAGDIEEITCTSAGRALLDDADASAQRTTLGLGPLAVFSWANISGTSQSAAVNTGYISSNASQTTVTLPATAAVGNIVAVEGLGAGGWILAANTGQTIKIGSSSTSTAGSLTSAAGSDNIYVICIVADTTWRVQTTNSAGLTVA